MYTVLQWTNVYNLQCVTVYKFQHIIVNKKPELIVNQLLVDTIKKCKQKPRVICNKTFIKTCAGIRGTFTTFLSSQETNIKKDHFTTYQPVFL